MSRTQDDPVGLGSKKARARNPPDVLGQKHRSAGGLSNWSAPESGDIFAHSHNAPWQQVGKGARIVGTYLHVAERLLGTAGDRINPAAPTNCDPLAQGRE